MQLSVPPRISWLLSLAYVFPVPESSPLSPHPLPGPPAQLSAASSKQPSAFSLHNTTSQAPRTTGIRQDALDACGPGIGVVPPAPGDPYAQGSLEPIALNRVLFVHVLRSSLTAL